MAASLTPYKDYDSKSKFLFAVDCTVFGVSENRLRLLIFEREVEPLAGEWSLLGSFINRNESTRDAASRILLELTGLDNIYMEQLHCFAEPNRDPGGPVISVAYWSLIKINQNDREFNVDNHKARWVSIDEMPELILDHGEMVTMAIRRLRERAKFYPIGFELVPKEFTLRQLLSVYEAIFDHKIDDRNFRKKILKSGLLTMLDKKDKTTSRKGSYLYEFNKDTYRQLQDKGYNFEF
ncbi:MAG: NUDIX hydrolase [Roseivirga sp.]|nr:NUDIX hydrolase [Roseivirga sp.]